MSKPIDITIHDNHMVVEADGLKNPIALENLHISQATKSKIGQTPVYLDCVEPRTKYTLYASPVDGSLVYHVESINGQKPDSEDQIFNILFNVVAV